jgi:hypothetical protein
MKTVSERPSVWNVLIPVMAFFYLSYFTAVLVEAIYVPGLFFTSIVLGTVLSFGWAYLIRDLIRQISLFFWTRTK